MFLRKETWIIIPLFCRESLNFSKAAYHLDSLSFTAGTYLDRSRLISHSFRSRAEFYNNLGTHFTKWTDHLSDTILGDLLFFMSFVWQSKWLQFIHTMVLDCVYSPALTPSLFGKYLLRVSKHTPHLMVAAETQSKYSWVFIFSSNNSGYKSLV